MKLGSHEPHSSTDEELISKELAAKDGRSRSKMGNDLYPGDGIKWNEQNTVGMNKYTHNL